MKKNTIDITDAALFACRTGLTLAQAEALLAMKADEAEARNNAAEREAEEADSRLLGTPTRAAGTTAGGRC